MGENMKRKISTLFIAVIVCIMMSSSVLAKGDTPNGQPFDAVWNVIDEIKIELASIWASLAGLEADLDAETTERIAADIDLQDQIDTIELTPGPRGEIGPQGIQGETGATGETGPQGIQGETGATGEIGPQGIPGETGATGETGPQGIQGETGATGATGPQGIQGETGATGAIGPQGIQGETGPQGIQGETGPQGIQGETGATGAIGPQGIPGETGAQGATGEMSKEQIAALCFLYEELELAVPDFCPGKIIFVSSQTYNGNLGGLAGADEKCAGLASAAGLNGEFKAWLSGISISAASRLVHSERPYERPDGAAIANDWNDLTDGAIQNPINIDENGAIQNSMVWSNTLTNGAIEYSYPTGVCMDWTASTDTCFYNRYNRICGAKTSLSYMADASWTDSKYGRGCSNFYRLYCVQQ